jgi:hypothetical protein
MYEAWKLIQGGADYGTRPEVERALSIVSDLKRIENDCNKNALDVPSWERASLVDRVHLLLASKTPVADNLQEWERLATSWSREISVVEKTIAGGTKGYVPDDPSADVLVLDMLKYVVHELERINVECERNKVESSEWESLSLAGKVAAITANSQTPELRQDIMDGISALNSHYVIPPELTSIQQMHRIVQGLETINREVNNVPFANDEWRGTPLVDRVNTIVAHRLVQESEKPSSELTDLLLDTMLDLFPSKGIRSDPTGLEYMATIAKELQSMEQAVNSTVDKNSTKEFGKWRIQPLSERVQSVTTEFNTSRDKVIAVMMRLANELEDMPPGPSRDRTVAILRKIFPDEDLVDPKEEEEKEKEIERPGFDPED